MTSEERILNGIKVLRELQGKAETLLYKKWTLKFLDLVEDHMRTCKSRNEVTIDVSYEEAKKTFSGLIDKEESEDAPS